MPSVSVSVSVSVPTAAETQEQVVAERGKPLGILTLGLMGHPMDLPGVREVLDRGAVGCKKLGREELGREELGCEVVGCEVVVDRLCDAAALYPYPSRGPFRSRGFYRGLARDTCPYPGLYLDPCLCLGPGPGHLEKTYGDPIDSHRHIFSKTTCIYHTCHIPVMTCSSRRRADMIYRSRRAVDPDHRALDPGPGPVLDHDRALDLCPDTCPALSPSPFLVLVVSPNHLRSSSRSARMGPHLHRPEQVRVGRPHARHVAGGRGLRIHLCARPCPYHLSECARNPDPYNLYECARNSDQDPCLGLGSGRGRDRHTSESEIDSSLCCSRASQNSVGSGMGGSPYRGLCRGQYGPGLHFDSADRR